MNGVLPHGNRNRRQFGLVDDDRWHTFGVHMFLCWLGCYALCCQTREDDANDQLKNGLKIQNNFFVRIIKSHIATTTTKPLWVWAMYIMNRRSASVKISLVHHHLAIEITRERWAMLFISNLSISADISSIIPELECWHWPAYFDQQQQRRHSHRMQKQ